MLTVTLTSEQPPSLGGVEPYGTGLPAPAGVLIAGMPVFGPLAVTALADLVQVWEAEG